LIERLKGAAFLLAVTVGSLIFASAKDLWLLPLVAAGMLVAGLWLKVIDRSARARQRRYCLYLSLVTNLGILGFFKYFNFFVGSVTAVLSSLGIEVREISLSIILPVGLSFYTFQAISRTMDSYRGKFDPARSIVNYAAYHPFFLTLVPPPT